LVDNGNSFNRLYGYWFVHSKRVEAAFDVFIGIGNTISRWLAIEYLFKKTS
jgi:hypothetical protein